MKNAITNYENTFFLNQTALSGVISVDGSYNLSMEPINVIGKGFLKQVVAEVPKAQLTVDRYLVNQDPVLNLTGNGYDYIANAVSAGLKYNNKSFAFGTGYLSSYSINCSVGDVPKIQSTFDVYGGDIGGYLDPSGAFKDGAVFVPQVKNIIISCNQSSTNRVKDFTLNVDCPNRPIYALNQSLSEIPVEVHSIYPFVVDGSFSLDVDNYESQRAYSIFSSTNLTNFSIKISGSVLVDQPLTTAAGVPLTTASLIPLYSYLKNESNVPIFNFNAANAIILSEQMTSSADDVLSVKISYKTYLN